MVEPEGKLHACTVLDCYVDIEEGMRISQIVMRHMNEDNSNRGKAKFQYFYDEAAKKGRYMIWGNPLFIGQILTAIGEATASQPQRQTRPAFQFEPHRLQATETPDR